MFIPAVSMRSGFAIVSFTFNFPCGFQQKQRCFITQETSGSLMSARNIQFFIKTSHAPKKKEKHALILLSVHDNTERDDTALEGDLVQASIEMLRMEQSKCEGQVRVGGFSLFIFLKGVFHAFLGAKWRGYRGQKKVTPLERISSDIVTLNRRDFSSSFLSSSTA